MDNHKVQLLLAVNDNGGSFSGRVSALQLSYADEIFLSAQPANLSAQKINQYNVDVQLQTGKAKFLLEFSNNRYFAFSKSEWVGNICWNEYTVSYITAFRIIEELLRQRIWAVSDIYTQLRDLVDSQTFTENRFMKFLDNIKQWEEPGPQPEDTAQDKANGNSTTEDPSQLSMF